MKINWKSAPLIRLIIPMIAGILVGIYSELSSYLWLLPLIGTASILGTHLLLTKRSPTLRKEFIFGVLTSVTLFFVGINLIVFKTSNNNASHYQKHLSDFHDSYLIEVVEIPKEKPNSIQVIASVTGVKQDSANWIKTTGEVLLYFKKDSNSLRILQGDKIYIQSNLQDIQPPQNPGQFNYKQYLSFNQIYQQGFVQANNWLLLSTNNNSIISYASGIRDQLLKTLKNNGLSDDELAVASALILGYKDDLDNELKHSYSSAGATHVLAVSGLHVGIIFIAISFVLGVFDKNEKLTFTRLFIVLVILWGYAILTGLSPSVVRAATMFTFVAVGKAFQRDSNIYNTLAGSALVLLIINPYLIMEVGFQLSYLAVLGIVYFQKIIYKQLYVKNKILNYIWSITSVSIAAQLTTFPLGLLYFHQFPTYFFISNLVVIPGAMIIIALGIGLFVTSWIPPVASLFGLLLYGVIYGMNWVVISIDKLPVSLVEGISISILECWIIYGMIVMMAIAKESRRLLFFNFGLVMLIVLIANDHVEDIQNRSQKEVVFYSIKGEPNINFIEGKTNQFICTEKLIEDRSTLLFNVKHHWFDLDLDNPQHYNLGDDIETKNLIGFNNYYEFNDQKIYHFISDSTSVETGKVDMLFISSESYYPIEKLIQQNNPETIILSNGCNWKFRKELENLYGKNSNLYHDIKQQGAYVKSL